MSDSNIYSRPHCSRLKENQTVGDFAGMLLPAAGITLYYYPWDTGAFSAPGLVFMLLSSVGYANNITLNRRLLTTRQVDVRRLVARTMSAGAVMLLPAGFWTEGAPMITGRLLLILACLGGISGAPGFCLRTRNQSALTAFESGSINNLMLIEIALPGFIVFRRPLNAMRITAIPVVSGAVLSIQRKTKTEG